MKLVLFEFNDEVDAFIHQYGKEMLMDNETLILCFHPKVRAYLKTMEIESRGTLEYLSNESQHEIMGFTDKKSGKLMEYLELRDEFGVTSSYKNTCLYHLRFYLNHFCWLIEVLFQVNRKHRFEEIYASMPINENYFWTEEALIQARERFLGFFAQQLCENHQMKFSSFKVGVLKKSKLENIKISSVRLIGRCLTTLSVSFLRKFYKKNASYVIVPALSYRMDNLLKDIYSKNTDVHSVMIWDGGSSLKQEMYKIYLMITNIFQKMTGTGLLDAVISLDLMNQNIESSQDSNDFDGCFDKVLDFIEQNDQIETSWRGISFSPYLAGKLQMGLRKEMKLLLKRTKILTRLFKEIKPKLLMSMYSNGIYGVMGELGPILDYESLIISHGTHVPPQNQFDDLENYHLAKSVILNDYQCVAVQTPWTEKFLNSYHEKRRRILTGPLLYSDFTSSQRSDARLKILNTEEKTFVIVHATTHKTREGMRFHIVETKDEYISSLTDIINVIKNCNNVHLIIRPHPACGLSKDDFSVLLPECFHVDIMMGGKFSDVLSVADLVISYSSTCIEEALQKEIPVVLFDKWKRYNHFGILSENFDDKIKKQPVYYIDSMETLSMKLNKIVGIFRNQKLNESELSDYKFPAEYRKNFWKYIKETLT